MTTIADKLGAIKDCKTHIASAIEAKGVPVAGASFSDYASLIGQISSSAGSDRIFQCTVASRDLIDLASVLPFPLVIDGLTFSDGNTVLLMGQPTGNNGLYQYAIDGQSRKLLRLEDEIQTQNLVFITSGSFIRHVFSNADNADVYVDISVGLDTKADRVHQHPIADITGLDAFATAGLDNVSKCSDFCGYMDDGEKNLSSLTLTADSSNSINIATSGTLTITALPLDISIDKCISLGFSASSDSSISWSDEIVWVDTEGVPPTWGTSGARLVVIVWFKAGSILASTIHNSES